LADEGQAFGLDEAAAEFGHRNTGLCGGDTVRKDGCAGITRYDVVVMSTGASASSGRRFKNPDK